MTDHELRTEVERQRDLMIAVATGGPRINAVNDTYCARRAAIASALTRRGLEDPNPHEDLWSWYGKWSSGDLPSWQSRREYINGLYAPITARLSAEPPIAAERPVEPTGWSRVDRLIGSGRESLARASNIEEFQAIGLLCREALISLAQAVYDPTLHASLDGVPPSETDAKRMLEAYIARELGGSSNEALRKHARAALDVANALQHKRTASFRDAALCMEATASTINIIAIISGIRDPLAADTTMRTPLPRILSRPAQPAQRRSTESLSTRMKRVLELKSAEQPLFGTFSRTIDGKKVSYKLPTHQGSFWLHFLQSGEAIDAFWYVSIQSHRLEIERELADVRVLLEQCSKGQHASCTFIIVTDEDARPLRSPVQRAFAKMKEFLPEQQRVLFTLELWDSDVLLEKEKELGIRVSFDV